MTRINEIYAFVYEDDSREHILMSTRQQAPMMAETRRGLEQFWDEADAMTRQGGSVLKIACFFRDNQL